MQVQNLRHACDLPSTDVNALIHEYVWVCLDTRLEALLRTSLLKKILYF